jgi:hypothetical protein
MIKQEDYSTNWSAATCRRFEFGAEQESGPLGPDQSPLQILLPEYG